MSITAQDIQQQGFEHSLRGYDVEQVDVFLEHVAQEVDALVTENESLKAQLGTAAPTAEGESAPAVEAGVSEDAQALIAQAEANAKAAADQTRAVAAQAKATEEQLAAAKAKIEELKKQLEEKGSMDNTISNAFISAQKAADSMLSEAQSSADALKEEARSEGERIYRESEAKARELIREALAEKQAILDETEALTTSCEEFRSQYRALMEHFSAEADKKFVEVDPAAVSSAAIDAALPKIKSGASERAAESTINDGDELIEEID